MGENSRMTADLRQKIVVSPFAQSPTIPYPERPWSSFASTTGGSQTYDASTNMCVAASQDSPVTFSITPHASLYDIHVLKFWVSMAGKRPSNDKFCTIGDKVFGGGLENGVDIILTHYGDDVVLAKDVKTSGALFEATGVATGVVAGATPMKLDSWKDKEDLQTFIFDLTSYLPRGIVLQRGTDNAIKLVVRDDLSSLKHMTLRATGYTVRDFEGA